MTSVRLDGRAGAGARGIEALLADLGLALEAAAPPHLAASLAESDPLRLELPPLPGIRAAPEALRAQSALYFAARLEDMGLVHAAEELVRRRAALRVPPATAARLDGLARREQRWYPREQRAALFARLFGTGSGVDRQPGGGNARFEPLLAALCSALVACGPRRAGKPDALQEAVARAGLELAATSGLVHTGASSLAVPVLTEQLRMAVDLLSDPGIGALVGARGLWPTLRRLLEPNPPDLRRLLDCARHGQHVLRWLADVAPGLESTAPAGPEIRADVVGSAAAWLTACGLAAGPLAPRGGMGPA